MRIAGTVLATRDPDELARFYERLLGWPRVQDEPDWIVVRGEGVTHALSFHTDELFEPPTWPSERGAQRITAHLDIATTDIEAAAEHARACGAVDAGFQGDDAIRVMVDPHGHPFCFVPGRPT
ncbi:MAG: VOC family protein [Ilumatobacter sp.]|nr:VOC family protein [Ilumatobacter sp.]